MGQFRFWDTGYGYLCTWEEQEVALMTTTAIDTTGTMERRESRTHARVQVGRIGIGFVAVLALLVAAWGGIVPYIGPLFGYGATGAGAWHWNLAHTLLALAPGAVGVLVAALVLTETRGLTVGRGRLSLSAAGFLLLLCGAWFVVGPAAWPAIMSSHGPYFVAATPMRNLVNQLGYNLGTGLVLGTCGGFILGWAARHGTSERAVEVPVAEVT
jgi:hypothetical protein